MYILCLEGNSMLLGLSKSNLKIEILKKKNKNILKHLKNVWFQGKPFNITVIPVYAPTTNAEEAEVEWFYDDLQYLLEWTPKKDVLFIIGDWNAKVGS